MTRPDLLLIACLLGGCATTGAVRDRGFTPARSTAELLQQASVSRRIAVVVGIDTYADPAFPDLRHAVHDAEGLAEILAAAPQGAFDQVLRFTTASSTTRDAVLGELARLASGLREEDVLVVYFSGHGTRVVDDGRWRRFLLTADSRAADLEGTAIDLADLQAFFSSLEPARKSLIVDACFSGDGKSVVRPAVSEVDVQDTPLAPRATEMGAGEAHMYATTSGRPAREDDELGHGVYTWYLMEALSWGFGEADLDGDKVVTAYEAHDYARSRTIERTGAVQVPEAAFRVVGEADLILTGSADERVRQDRSLVYLYPTHGELLDGATLMVDGRFRGSLPGTLPIEAGRHHVRLVDTAGDTISEGFAVLSGGSSYSARTLSRIVQGPEFGIDLAPSFTWGGPLAVSIGPGAGGVSASAWWRSRGEIGRGLTGRVGLAAQVSGSRPDPMGGSIRSPRLVATVDAALGYQHDHRRLRYRVGWGAGFVVIPPDHGDEVPDEVDPTSVPWNAGWLFPTTGPDLAVGYVINESWSLQLAVKPHLTWLDLGQGATVVPWVSTGLGVSWSM